MPKPLETEMTIRGTTIRCFYTVSGCHMAANEIDAEEKPVVESVTVEIADEDITALLDEGLLETIRERIEATL